MNVLAFGDVVGRPGRVAFGAVLPAEIKSFAADAVIVNGENAAGGLAIDENSALELRAAGATVLTLGDHTYHKKDASAFLNANSDWCIRPANYPSGAPGRGWTCIECAGKKLGVMNLMGRVFMSGALDCPFRSAEGLLAKELAGCDSIIVDFHAEASSEKYAMARFLDGRVSLLFGTHTHVPTADEQVLPGGTAYVTDLGMCGARDSVIGMESTVAIKRFYEGLPHGYRLADAGPILVQGVASELEGRRARSITRVKKMWDEK